MYIYTKTFVGRHRKKKKKKTWNKAVLHMLPAGRQTPAQMLNTDALKA